MISVLHLLWSSPFPNTSLRSPETQYLPARKRGSRPANEIHVFGVEWSGAETLQPRSGRLFRRASLDLMDKQTSSNFAVMSCLLFVSLFPHGSMYKYALADRFLRLLIPVAFFLTTYLYLYPVFHGCVFPTTTTSTVTALTETFKQHWIASGPSGAVLHPPIAPFRLLALADPQLEGDSSLPKPEDAFRHKLWRHWAELCRKETQEIFPSVLRTAREVISKDMLEALKGVRKRIDLFGNDYYLGHIFRTLHWWTKPTHVTVLGDLIGSQWVTSGEFDWRGWRFWNRVFGGGRKIEDHITVLDSEEEEKVFEMTDTSWRDQIVNIAGNHDIGYAGDILGPEWNVSNESLARPIGTSDFNILEPTRLEVRSSLVYSRHCI